MRQIVRFCAGCHQQGVRTELSETEPDVTIIVDRYGAHTDLCTACHDRLLGPVLEIMATGLGLDEMPLADWSKLGQQLPTTRTLRRGKQKPIEPAVLIVDSVAAAQAGEFRCVGCGKEFASAASLGGHKKHFGDRPHDPPKSRGKNVDSNNAKIGRAHV